jgi:pilus assembly protein Flp/PilA
LQRERVAPICGALTERLAQPLPIGGPDGLYNDRHDATATPHRNTRDAFPEEDLMNGLMTRFWRDEEGQDLLEYALLVALIALVAIVAVTGAGAKVSEVFTSIASQIP